MTSVGRIGLDMNVVAERPVRPVQELDDAKTFIDRVEQGAVAIFAHRPRAALSLAQVGRAQPRNLLLKRSGVTLKIFDFGLLHASLPESPSQTRSGGLVLPVI
jgi:hypothetical protein